MKFTKVVIIIIMLTLFSGMHNAPLKSKNIILNCHSAVLIDQLSGNVLYSKNASALLPMASTTKIMTTIVALEKGNLNDEVTVSKKAASVSGSSAGLKAGEKIKLEELLYGLMLRSGNDAAIAIAEHIGGSVEKFSSMMNYKAIELGAYFTSFTSPHGLDNPNHFTTANDLAKITAYCMKNKTFRDIVGTKSISCGATGKFNHSYSNINKFLYSSNYADGVKTGYTGNAGKCLVASATNQSNRLICVILNGNNRFSDASKLINYGISEYSYKTIKHKGIVCSIISKKNNQIKKAQCYLQCDVTIPIKNDNTSEITEEVFIPSQIQTDNTKDVIGNIVFKQSDNIISRYPLYLYR